MTDYKQIFRYVFIVIAVLLVIGLEVTTARGGRGGGGGGRGGGSAGRGGGGGWRGGGSRGGTRGGQRGLGYGGGSGSSAGWKPRLAAGTTYHGSPDAVTSLALGGSLMAIIFVIALMISCRNCLKSQKRPKDTALRAQPRTAPVGFVGTDVGLQLVGPAQN